MSRNQAARRHADGALDLDRQRRLAARLRRMARRRAWRAAGALMRRLAVALPLASAAAPAVAQDFRAEPLPPEPRADGRLFRMTLLDLAPGAATAAHLLPAESLLLVTEGTVVRDLGDGEPVAFAAGAAFVAPGPVVLRNAGDGPARLSIGSLAAPGVLPRPVTLWEGAE